MIKTDRPDLTLYVRSLRPRQGHERQRAVIERLAALERSDRIESYSVVVWGRQLPASVERTQTDVGRELLERIALFEEWARRNGYSASDTFPERDVETRITGERLTARMVPQLTLAEFHGHALSFVSPVSLDRDDPSVEDRLDTIENGDPYPESLVSVERARSEGEPSVAGH